MIMQNIHSLFV